ncbi:MAG: DUF898 family protein [Devosia sp.]|uniref:DUF898 family protein n=1 Tax=Devosia sp. TaxID=1871048 RepID=UPI0024CB2ED0|nr:DUF898 family protein [Devosia sp.]UYN99443.1 MAG: DUF898 family protein [Devosia sp.]
MQQVGSVEDRVTFSGARWQFAALLLPGYALMVPTLGLNRFWLTTAKRRFLWGNTIIGGDALEYTGEARQLLLGFLMALAVFIPVYGLFFYLSTQTGATVVIGYGAVAVLVWFLHGYALYRARDFRLSRTLWRGIRFDQAGNAWAYALRRFLWSVLNVVTLGLAYPFMAANLWSYRYRHTWYGDRSFGFTGSWKQLALPYYPVWLVMGIVIIAAAVVANEYELYERPLEADPAAFMWLAIHGLFGTILVTLYRCIEMTRLFSAVTLGGARLRLSVSPFHLFGQFLAFGLALFCLYLLLALGGVLVLGLVAGEAFAGGGFDLNILMGSMQSSLLALLAIIAGYLLLFGAFALVNEVVLGFGFWTLLARGATLVGLETLDNVHARDEDRALAGEGLADALNVGGY